MKALVLGGSGFMGGALVRRLLADGHHVTATFAQAASLPEHPRLRWRQLDLARFDDYPALIGDADTIFHLAWSTVPSTAEQDPLRDASDNVMGSLRLLDALRANARPRLIFASSGGTVYGCKTEFPIREEAPVAPISAYGSSKVAVENHIRYYARRYGFPAIILRIGNPFGPGQSADKPFGAIATFCRRAANGQTLTIYGDGSVVRDYIFIDDVVDAFLLAAGVSAQDTEVINIGSGRGRSLNEVIASIGAVLHRDIAVEHRPARAFDVPVSILDIARARARLNWTPQIAFEAGIRRTLDAQAAGGA